jgi:predicted metalloprotease
MKIDGHRRSTRFEDRGTGGVGGGAVPVALLFGLARRLGLKGTLILGAVLGVGYFVLPSGIRSQLLGQVTGGGTAQGGPGKAACELSEQNGKACDFSRVVLASTEDVWHRKFETAALPRYGSQPGAYHEPTLVVFSRAVGTRGCGNATSAVGPFYCPADRKLYIDPSFYQVMETRLKAPGDFAQAYVLAHEVGHHVQNLIGSSRLEVEGETANQVSVRVELQADCFAGVWGNTARASLNITDEDLKEALTAAHAIGDDELGHSDTAAFTHGSSEQRMRWFRRGFDGGDARRCDTFAVKRHAEL